MRDQRMIIDNLSLNSLKVIAFLQGDIGCGKSTLLHCLLGLYPIPTRERLAGSTTPAAKKRFCTTTWKDRHLFPTRGRSTFWSNRT